MMHFAKRPKNCVSARWSREQSAPVLTNLDPQSAEPNHISVPTDIEAESFQENNYSESAENLLWNCWESNENWLQFTNFWESTEKLNIDNLLNIYRKNARNMLIICKNFVVRIIMYIPYLLAETLLKSAESFTQHHVRIQIFIHVYVSSLFFSSARTFPYF